MTSDRLASDFWVRAYLARLRRDSIPAFIAATGDPDAGAILVKLNRLDGSGRIFQRVYDMDADKWLWKMLDEGSDSDLDEYLERQHARDPDLWIVEVEDKSGRHMLDEPGMDS